MGNKASNSGNQMLNDMGRAGGNMFGGGGNTGISGGLVPSMPIVDSPMPDVSNEARPNKKRKGTFGMPVEDPVSQPFQPGPAMNFNRPLGSLNFMGGSGFNDMNNSVLNPGGPIGAVDSGLPPMPVQNDVRSLVAGNANNLRRVRPGMRSMGFQMNPMNFNRR